MLVKNGFFESISPIYYIFERVFYPRCLSKFISLAENPSGHYFRPLLWIKNF